MTETKAAILSYAESRESFRFADLLSYLNGLFKISKVNLSWHLKELLKDNLLFKLGRGIYTLQNAPTNKYVPRLGNKIIRVGKALSSAFPFITISVFDGNVLADFQHHLSSNNLHYIEVEREAMEPVFHFLQKRGFTAYLNPDKNFVYNILVLQNWLERIRKEVTNKVLSIKRISDFLIFPILAQPTLKKI